jgi:hypothetical protein
MQYSFTVSPHSQFLSNHQYGLHLDPISSELNIDYFLKMHFYIILQYTLKSQRWSLAFKISNQYIYAFLSPQERYMLWPSNISNSPNNICVLYLLTYLRSWALPEKLPIVQPLRTSQHFKEPKGSSPCSQGPSTGPYPEPVRSIPSHRLSLRSILILYTHLRLGLPSDSGLFLSGFPINILYAFLVSPIRATCSSNLILLDFIILIMFNNICVNYKLRSFSKCNFHQLFCYLLPLTSKCNITICVKEKYVIF